MTSQHPASSSASSSASTSSVRETREGLQESAISGYQNVVHNMVRDALSQKPAPTPVVEAPDTNQITLTRVENLGEYSVTYSVTGPSKMRESLVGILKEMVDKP